MPTWRLCTKSACIFRTISCGIAYNQKRTRLLRSVLFVSIRGCCSERCNPSPSQYSLFILSQWRLWNTKTASDMELSLNFCSTMLESPSIDFLISTFAEEMYTLAGLIISIVHLPPQLMRRLFPCQLICHHIGQANILENCDVSLFPCTIPFGFYRFAWTPVFLSPNSSIALTPFLWFFTSLFYHKFFVRKGGIFWRLHINHD